MGILPTAAKNTLKKWVKAHDETGVNYKKIPGQKKRVLILLRV